MKEGGSESGCEEGRPPRVPKEEGTVNPINPCGELARLNLRQGENRAFPAQFSAV